MGLDLDIYCISDIQESLLYLEGILQDGATWHEAECYTHMHRLFATFGLEFKGFDNNTRVV